MAYDNENKNQQRKRIHYSPNLIGCLQNAIENHKIATMEYESRENGVSKRDIEPMAIIHKNRKKHLVAYCLLRQDYRTFRLDRINLFKIISSHFEPRAGFDAASFEEDKGYASEYSSDNDAE